MSSRTAAQVSVSRHLHHRPGSSAKNIYHPGLLFDILKHRKRAANGHTPHSLDASQPRARPCRHPTHFLLRCASLSRSSHEDRAIQRAPRTILFKESLFIHCSTTQSFGGSLAAMVDGSENTRHFPFHVVVYVHFQLISGRSGEFEGLERVETTTDIRGGATWGHHLLSQASCWLLCIYSR